MLVHLSCHHKITALQFLCVSLVFVFFFSAKINNFCSKRIQYNQEIISLK